ncbi:MAG: class C sortase [Eubacteriales bacterium]|nr:class C sortase [Eubacteriales bacterium]
MKKNVAYIILVLVFFVGLGVMLYPTISDYVNSKVQSKAIVDYEATLSQMTEKDYTEIFQKADEYNAALRSMDYPFMYYDRLDGYMDMLRVDSSGIMGYVGIDKIKVELPIYHGTSDTVLNSAAGHLEGSSLPVGGESTHCVISAHRGLPSAKLFTNLDKLEPGDTFTVTVLDRVLTYEVFQVLIVEPSEVSALYVMDGEDLCTLVTCTPYGINTHRLLVQGRRIETEAPKPVVYVPNDAFRIDPLIVAPAVAAPMLLVLLISLFVQSGRKKDSDNNDDSD